MAVPSNASRSGPVVRLVCPAEATVPIRCVQLEIPRSGEYCLNYTLDPSGAHPDDLPDGAVELPGVGFVWIERVGDLRD